MHMSSPILNKLSLLFRIWIMFMFMLPGNLPAQNKVSRMDKNKQLIQTAFDRWATGSGSFFDLLADDVRWTITGNSPISKTYNSRQQFLDEAISPINARLSEKIIPTLRALYAEGDMVIALWDGKAMAKDGIPYNNTYSWYMKVKDERIIEVIAFFDSIELADLWKRLPHPAHN